MTKKTKRFKCDLCDFETEEFGLMVAHGYGSHVIEGKNRDEGVPNV